MQTLPGILQLKNGVGSWSGSNGEYSDTPRLTLALAAKLMIDLRSAVTASPESADLAPYPIEELHQCASWYIAVDSDYDQLTMPPIKRFTGISVAEVEGKTILESELPNMDSEDIRKAVKTVGEVPMKAEIGGLDGEGRTVFVMEFPLLLKNRIYIPDGSGGEAPDPTDPEYLTTAQVRAYILSEIETALDELEVPPGAIGPAPALEIGTVTSGEQAGASITETEPGKYEISLTLPRAADGETLPAIAPQLSIGTVEGGATAAVTIEPVSGTPGAYTLNLTLPRGADGSGVSPAGQWSAAVSYNLNAAVRHAAAWWRSLHDDNLGNEPPTTRIDDDHWEVIVKDGFSADPLIVSYNSTDNPDDSDWHLYRRATDRYFRWTTDGGKTFTEAMEISQSSMTILLRYNIDATTDWRDLPAAEPGKDYHVASGKYIRIRTDVGGVWGEGKKIHDIEPDATFRVQFGATPKSGDPDWHANYLPGDDRILLYNTVGTIRMDLKVSLGDGEEIDGVQLCEIEDAWHAEYDPEADLYQRISVDSGVTWSQPMLMRGRSAYEEWLAKGNTGSVEEFLGSLRCQLPAGQKGQVLMLGANGEPVWGDLASYTPVPPPPEIPSEVELNLADLPDGVEKRIWEFLPVRRPADGRALHLFWQSSANGLDWGTLYSSATHPHCVRTKGAASLVDFDTTYGPAMLPVEHIPVLEIHLRTCWGFLDDDNIWHKGDWTYHNTLGVRLSLEGQPLEKPDYYNPEYFIIPIPDGTDQCEFRLSTDENFREEQVLFSNTIYTAEVRGFFFNGQDLLPATPQTVETLPVPFNAEAFEGQWFVFKRRGTPKWSIRAVWTGDNPVVYEWNPQQAYLQED
jgi:hypothetical protein